MSSNLTASAKYLKGNQIHSLIPFFFGTILALFEILAIEGRIETSYTTRGTLELYLFKKLNNGQFQMISKQLRGS